MWQPTIHINEAIEYLNSVAQADPLGVRALLCIYIPCTEALSEHPTCIVNGDWTQGYTVGIVGLLNGLFGYDDDWLSGQIAYTMDEDGSNLRFVRVTENMLSKEEEKD